MEINYNHSYRKPVTGNVTFVYDVIGTPEELATYKDVQGIHYRIDKKTEIPVWFTTRYCGEHAKLNINKDGTKFFADTSEFDKLQSIVSQYGGNAGESMANVLAQRLFGTLPKGKTPPVAGE